MDATLQTEKSIDNCELFYMAENNTLLGKLDGLVARFEEVSTLITDPNVIADQKRYVKLTKEYKELGDIMNARKGNTCSALTVWK